jgi:SAM-dependent methyltransferase
VLEALGARAATLLDYGCGAGGLIQAAAARGWRAVGVELDAGVAAAVRERTGLLVCTADDLPHVLAHAPVHALHLGDVVEHMTDPLGQLAAILGHVAPGGTVIAQGPLEAHPNLFDTAIRAARWVRRPQAQEFAPYHVLLATAEGQRRLFRRAGLQEVRFHLSEVDWPAPGRLRRSDWRCPRAVALFALRRVSRAVSRLRPRAWGNRYFYVGRTAATPA